MIMDKQSYFSEQIKRAKKEVASWSPEKRSSMRLQGTDNFHEREQLDNNSSEHTYYDWD